MREYARGCWGCLGLCRGVRDVAALPRGATRPAEAARGATAAASPRARVLAANRIASSHRYQYNPHLRLISAICVKAIVQNTQYCQLRNINWSIALFFFHSMNKDIFTYYGGQIGKKMFVH